MKFGQHVRTLCNKNVSIKLRLKLFDSVVSPSLLFGLAVLPLQVSCVEKLNVVQRKMLRKIIGRTRISEELWVDTMRRMSMKVDTALLQSKMQMWSTRLAVTQWKFVGRLKTLPVESWPNRAANWQPQEVEDLSCEFVPHRVRGHPFTRWDDRVTKFSRQHFGQKW